MEAIKTKYKGIQFRSKLEARVAVFFDYYGMKWEYEPQSFKLSTGIIYCPDFYLIDLDCYCEVKPLREAETDKYDLKITENAYISIDEFFKLILFEKNICLIIGIPTDRNFILFHRNGEKSDYDHVYPTFDTKMNPPRWRWWSCSFIEDYPKYGNIKQCAEIARYHDFFNF